MANDITSDNRSCFTKIKTILLVMEPEESLDIPAQNFLPFQHFEQLARLDWFSQDGEHIVNMQLLHHENGSQHSFPKG